MKRLPLVILVFGLLTASVVGCNRSARYDARLVVADSLMQVNPDSSLAIVEGLCRDSLATEGDRAYRDLLLTQARYRCYVTATSDSDINRALAYYRAHPKEREKLTRANIYKGAVMDELGLPDSAMLYYKQAEAVADPTDYFNLGYAKMRMGTLYLDNYAMDGQHIKKLEEAISYFRRCSNTHYELRCMTILGAIHRLKKPEKAQELLTEAMNRASQINDTSNFIFSAQNLMQAYYEKKRYAEAAKIVRKLMENRDQNLNFAFYANSADIYAKIGKPDSAEYILGLADKGLHFNAIDEIMYFESLGEIALARGDKETYNLMDKKCRLMEDSLMALDKTIDIIKTEEQETLRIQQENNKRNNLFTNWLIAVIALALIALMIIVSFYYHRRHRYDALISELKETSESQLLELAETQERLNRLHIRDTKMRDFFDSHTWLIREVIEESYHTSNAQLIKRIKKIVQFQDQNKDKWTDLYDYIDLVYNNIMSTTKSNCPQLNDREMLLLALSVLNYSCIQISFILGYSNATSIGTIRQRLAQKMGLDISLVQYIDSFKN